MQELPADKKHKETNSKIEAFDRLVKYYTQLLPQQKITGEDTDELIITQKN